MQETFLGPDARTQCVIFCYEYTNDLQLIMVFTEVLAVPKNMKLLAIPLFELYDNAAR